jgi:hypothetical protein
MKQAVPTYVPGGIENGTGLVLLSVLAGYHISM